MKFSFKMKCKKFLAALLALTPLAAAADEVQILTPLPEGSGPAPQVVSGSLDRYTAHSPEVGADYTVHVWLPQEYTDNPDKTFPVIYMHDGQNLFDPAMAAYGSSWEIDDAMTQLAGEGVIRNAIIVGVFNRGELRPSDLIPQKVLTEYMTASELAASGMPETCGRQYHSDAYTKFLATTLKEAIDSQYRTLPGREDTFIMGSSMGGLASLYALCEYPQIYGGAACLSTHWIGNFDKNSTIFPTAMLRYMKEHLPDAQTHVLYLDRGTVELDSYYENWENQARKIAGDLGYTEEKGNFSCYTDVGATHNEAYWAARADRPLHQLIGVPGVPFEPWATGETTYEVFFQDSSRSWNPVYCFVWNNKGTVHLGQWPGTKMEQCEIAGKPAWRISFTHRFAPTNIIFHNNRGTQTADLVFANNSVYDFHGITGTHSAVESLPSANALQVMGGRGQIRIIAPVATTARLCTVGGNTRLLTLHAGETVIPLAPGLYLLDSRKIQVK